MKWFFLISMTLIASLSYSLDDSESVVSVEVQETEKEDLDEVEDFLPFRISKEEEEEYVSAGITESFYMRWLFDEGVSSAVAKSYFDSGITNYYDMLTLFNQGILAVDAKVYIRAGIGIGGMDWLRFNGVSNDEAKKYLEAGVKNVFDIIYLANQGVAPDVVKKHTKVGVEEGWDIVNLLKNGFTTLFNVEALSSGLNRSHLHRLSKTVVCEPYADVLKVRELKVCDLYGELQIRFVDFHEIDDFVVDQNISLPLSLYELILDSYYYLWMSHDDIDAFFEELDIIFADNDLSQASVSDLILISSNVVADRLDYFRVDDGLPTIHQSPIMAGSSLFRYWQEKVGDCDKYSALNIIVFQYLKMKYPEKLKNIYMSGPIFPLVGDHTWNTIIVLGKDKDGYDQLVVSYIDPTFYDQKKYGSELLYRTAYQLGVMNKFSDKLLGGEWHQEFDKKNKVLTPKGERRVLNAMDSYHFDKEHFMEKFRERFCHSEG